MSDSALLRRNLFAGFLFLFAGVITSCTPNPSTNLKANGISTGVSAQSSTQLACQEMIRSRMESLTVPFQETEPAFSSLTQKANQARGVPGRMEYSVRRSSGETEGLLVTSSINSSSKTEQVNYDLSANPADWTALFSVTLEYTRIESGEWLHLSQRFSTSKDCVSKLVQTSMEKIAPASVGYDYEISSIFADGGREAHANHFSIPPGRRLVNIALDALDPRAFQDGDAVYMQGIGTVLVSRSEMFVAKSEAFGLQLNEHISKYETTTEGRPFLEVIVAEDTSQNVMRFDLANLTTWFLPFSLWKQQSLGVSAGLTRLIDFQLPAGYLKDHPSFLVTSDRLPKYEHLAAYFNIIPISASGDDKTYAFFEQGVPTIRDKAVPEDLVSTATLDQSDPGVEKIVQSILAQKPADRRATIALILKYLGENYSFDSEMFSNNVIRPLSVAEALGRGKGVCQHYSVIFTTVARALGVPSRIIVGFLLEGSSPGGHAWVEAEVETGLFQVIEPQQPFGLTTTTTRKYIPVARADFLEAIRGDHGIAITALVQTRMKISPLPGANESH